MTNPINKRFWTVLDVDRLTLKELFTPQDIKDKKETLKKSISKSVDRIYKAKYGNEF